VCELGTDTEKGARGASRKGEEAVDQPIVAACDVEGKGGSCYRHIKGGAFAHWGEGIKQEWARAKGFRRFGYKKKHVVRELEDRREEWKGGLCYRGTGGGKSSKRESLRCLFGRGDPSVERAGELVSVQFTKERVSQKSWLLAILGWWFGGAGRMGGGYGLMEDGVWQNFVKKKVKKKAS